MARSTRARIVRELSRHILVFLPDAAVRHIYFFKVQKSIGNFRQPRTINEKINWRIINDRRTELRWTCDKLLMKEHAADVPDLVIPKVFWAGRDLADLRSAPLPARWVLKPNHRTGLVYFGTGRVEDVDKLKGVTRGWLDDFNGRVLREWAYAQARRCFIVEEFIGTEAFAPDDFKFYVFGGKVKFIQVDTTRFSDHRESYYSPTWEKMAVTWGLPDAGPVPRPASLDKMIGIAENLGRNFDFIRVDLYAVGDLIYFGEVTPYPSGGLDRIEPRSFDRRLGDEWVLPSTPPPARFKDRGGLLRRRTSRRVAHWAETPG